MESGQKVDLNTRPTVEGWSIWKRYLAHATLSILGHVQEEIGSYAVVI